MAKMINGRIPLPVIGQFGGTIHVTDDGAFIRAPNGIITWSYSVKSITGKGIFVAACARSGTVYIAKVLGVLGYNVGHEISGPDGSVGYHLTVVKPKNCFHQVRHPLKQISSSSTLQCWGFAEKVIDINPNTLLGRMQYWLVWNKMCEEFCVWRYQLEDLPNVWPEFLERIGHKQIPLPNISIEENTRKYMSSYKEVTWADLFKENEQLARNIQEKAREYGYDNLADRTVESRKDDLSESVSERMAVYNS